MRNRQEVKGLPAVVRDAATAASRIGQTDDGERRTCITFRDYMELCLYHPEFGYYRSGSSRVGREGDFYTSAYVGDIMGEQLAERLTSLADEHFGPEERVEVIDWGGGTGRLSRHMLEAWSRSSNPIAGAGRMSITVADRNPAHRALAEESLADWIGSGRARVVDPDRQWPWSDGKGGADVGDAERGKSPVIIVANELLDAFPVHRLTCLNGGLLEQGVAWDEEKERPVACLTELSDPRLAAWLEREGLALAEHQMIEISIDAASWIGSLPGRFERAILVLIDYGDESEELISSHRMEGTLMCYFRHQAHDDPFIHLGEQDITAHVNFSILRKEAKASGWREIWYGSQKRFLVESGLLEKLVAHTVTDPFHPTVRRNRAIRQLLLSDGMSELFKVQIWEKTRT
ncbi:class I SAM-dependent methyltransferase [Cohnella faecalis]|uniref:SAM-dependent methyltransferase n=1 Tax=Cohnella faecalis TaxID=2315694 RepID=A0A398CNR2_9BACL|nr:SAM-dependent methyltransferase [Cohnella faecalis]RIE04243.1 SAM-dependent methyltransferase [Cohnella faecalis]